MATADRDEVLRSVLASLAPGTDLRDGLERILRGNTGALVVLGYDKTVESICTGGFPLDVEFSATRLRELAKMDGAVVVTNDVSRIIRAATHLMPDPQIPTEESGTRHRTAQRVAQQTGFPVISVSQSMKIISLYLGGRRHVLENSTSLLSRANQAVATLERYKSRLDEVSQTLAALEIEDLVTVRDAASVSQRLEMVTRIADEISGYGAELGTDGRLLSLQLEELMAGVVTDRELIVRDYLPSGRRARTAEQAQAELAELSSAEMLDLTNVAKALGYPATPETLDQPVSPRGYRLLARVPRLPSLVLTRIVEHFGSLQKVLAATVDELQNVEGVGDARARTIREALSRLADASIMERYS
jgi:diadenylate cyclase